MLWLRYSLLFPEDFYYVIEHPRNIDITPHFILVPVKFRLRNRDDETRDGKGRGVAWRKAERDDARSIVDYEGKSSDSSHFLLLLVSLCSKPPGSGPISGEHFHFQFLSLVFFSSLSHATAHGSFPLPQRTPLGSYIWDGWTRDESISQCYRPRGKRDRGNTHPFLTKVRIV